MNQQPKIKTEYLATGIVTNGGQDVADLVRDSDPDGNSVEHLIVRTGRMIDRLSYNRVIEEDHYQAASVLRDSYERASLVMGHIASQGMGRVRGTSHEMVADEVAWSRYVRAMQAVPFGRHVLRAVVIDDEAPGLWGRRHGRNGLLDLQNALATLVVHFGIGRR